MVRNGFRPSTVGCPGGLLVTNFSKPVLPRLAQRAICRPSGHKEGQLFFDSVASSWQVPRLQGTQSRKRFGCARLDASRDSTSSSPLAFRVLRAGLTLG